MQCCSETVLYETLKRYKLRQYVTKASGIKFYIIIYIDIYVYDGYMIRMIDIKLKPSTF